MFGSFEWTHHFNFFELSFDVILYPVRITPLDLILRIDPSHPKRRCSGAHFNMRTFLLDVGIKLHVKECHYGLVGHLTGTDGVDCTWRQYRSEIPVHRLTFEGLNFGAKDGGTILDYSCQNWYSAGWSEWPLQ